MDNIIIPILQVGKLRLREIVSAQDQSTSIITVKGGLSESKSLLFEEVE